MTAYKNITNILVREMKAGKKLSISYQSDVQVYLK